MVEDIVDDIVDGKTKNMVNDMVKGMVKDNVRDMVIQWNGHGHGQGQSQWDGQGKGQSLWHGDEHTKLNFYLLVMLKVWYMVKRHCQGIPDIKKGQISGTTIVFVKEVLDSQELNNKIMNIQELGILQSTPWIKKVYECCMYYYY